MIGRVEGEMTACQEVHLIVHWIPHLLGMYFWLLCACCHSFNRDLIFRVGFITMLNLYSTRLANGRFTWLSVATYCVLHGVSIFRKLEGNKTHLQTATRHNLICLFFHRVASPQGEHYKYLSSLCALRHQRTGSSDFWWLKKYYFSFAPLRMSLLKNICCLHVGIWIIAIFRFMWESVPEEGT